MRDSGLGINIRIVWAIIYLVPFAGSVLFLIFDFKDKDIRFHALQALFSASLVALIHALLYPVTEIFILGAFVTIFIIVLYVLCVFLMFIALFRAFSGERLIIPGPGSLAKLFSR